MGGNNKALLELAGERLIDRTLSRLMPQCTPVAISVQAPAPWTGALGIPVLADDPPHNAGPLAGIAAALNWANALSPTADWVLTVPVDVPFLPADLATRLTDADCDAAVATSAGQQHHTIAAWRPRLAPQASEALQTGVRAVHAFQSGLQTRLVDWPGGALDPFLNINTPQDLERAEQRESAE